MDDEEQRAELRRFLKDRRARVRPADVGIPVTGHRRVRGLRREEVAALAGIGVSWYTSLENGDAKGVSETTLLAVAEALRLSESERKYLLALAGPAPPTETPAEPSPLLRETMHAIAFPAYLITASWAVIDCNAVFRSVWDVSDALPFNAVERLFVSPAARVLHGEHFEENIAPVIAMLHSGLGRRPNLPALRAVRDRLLADDATRALWDAYEIGDPLVPNVCTIEASFGTFTYEALTLANPGELAGLVVQVPDIASRQRLSAANGVQSPVATISI